MGKNKSFYDLDGLDIPSLMLEQVHCIVRMQFVKHVKLGATGALAVLVSQIVKIWFSETGIASSNITGSGYWPLLIIAIYTALSVLAFAHSEASYLARKELIDKRITVLLAKPTSS